MQLQNTLGTTLGALRCHGRNYSRYRLCQLSEALPGPNKFWWLQLRTSIPDVAAGLLVQKTIIAATYCRRPGFDGGVMSRVPRPLECRSVTCIAYFVCETSAGRGRGVSANGTVRYRCLAQDEPADQRHSGRDWTPDGTSYFSVGEGCRLLPRNPRWRAKSPPFSEVAVESGAVEPLVVEPEAAAVVRPSHQWRSCGGIRSLHLNRGGAKPAPRKRP